jgi:hypothetical protein
VGAAFLASVLQPAAIFPIWYWIMLKRLEIDPAQYFFGSVARGILPALMVLGVLLFPSFWLPETSSPGILLLLAVPLALIVFGVSYAFGLDTNARTQIKGVLDRVLRGVMRRAGTVDP